MTTVDVYPLPSWAGASQLHGATAVVIDVLRATTSMIAASAAGARRIVPLTDIEEARRRKAALEAETPGNALLAGEREGVPIAGFDFGNSPQSFTPEKVAGKTILFTTTNGTVAMEAARPARRTLLAGFVNAAAVVRRLRHEDRIAILCAGTDGNATEEDSLLAGCLVARLVDCTAAPYALNDEAEKAKNVWQEFLGGKSGDALIAALTESLRRSRGGRNLLELGLDADIAAAARVDSLDAVPEF